MTRPRKKKKPDSVRVNFVESVGGTRKGIRVKSVSYPVAPTPSIPTCEPSHCIDQDQHDPAFDQIPDIPSAQGSPCSHRARKEKAAEAWAEARSKITPAMITGFGFPKDGVCIFCDSHPICVWCPDCGPNAYLCENCTQRVHKVINCFHSPLLWKVNSTL